MTNSSSLPSSRPKRINWAPYALILPSVLYLALFFAWPMARGLTLAVWDDEGLLTLHTEAARESADAGALSQNASVEVLGRQGNLLSQDAVGQANTVTEVWFHIRGEDPQGQPVEGWAPESRIRVRESDASGAPIMGTVRRKLGDESDPLTSVFAETNEKSLLQGKVDANAQVQIDEQAVLEVWYLVRGDQNGTTIEGWAPSRYIQLFGDTGQGRVDRGDTGELTMEFLQKMLNDRFFWPALTTTLLLILIIIPVQFVLAIVMALVVQARLRGNSLFLYIFTIPLGVSELAVGILWFSIFTQNGMLNSMLEGMGLISEPAAYLTADTRYWILIAVWLAEIWRATSLVMVIVVSGLQAIPDEVLEAAEIFGAGLWQRVRYVILPMLRPSLQVALILRTILALQVFAVVIALSGGDVVTVLANETYRQYSLFRNANVAAAYATLILLISMATAVFYLRAVRTQEEAAP